MLDTAANSAEQPKLSLHLAALENEAIHIFREVVAEFDNPVMLYSVGKDSSVLLHIDTGWKFRQMIEFRDQVVVEHGLRLISHNQSAR